MAVATPVLGNNAHFLFNALDLSGDGNQIRFAAAQDVHDVSAFGSTWKNFISGLAGAEITFNAYYDSNTGQVEPTLFAGGNFGVGATRTFEIDPVNNTAGGTFFKYTGNAFVVRFELDSRVNAAVTLASSFRVTGTVTRAVIP